MSAGHTPGPWEMRHEFGMQSLVYPVGSEYPVAATTGYYSRAGQSEANTRLIAAAPCLQSAAIELLAAAENSMDPADGDDVAAMLRFGAAEEAMRAAISKSQGGQS